MSALAMKEAPVSTDDQAGLFRRARTWWTIIALFLIAQANGLFGRQDEHFWKIQASKYESSPEFLLLTIATWGLCLLLMLGHYRRILRFGTTQVPILWVMALVFGSTLWSQDPGLTLRRSVLFALLVAFTWYFATFYSPSDQMRVLIGAGMFIGVLSIAMALFLPEFGISSAGEWKGVFGQKNRLGLHMLFFFSVIPFRPVKRLSGFLLTAVQSLVCLSLILLSQSRTSLMLAVLIVGVRIFSKRWRNARRDQKPFVFLLVLALVAIAVFGKPILLEMLGKDPTLTGRTNEWAQIWLVAKSHFWLGYGYQAFWTGSGDSLAVINAVGGAMHGADSGFVDNFLQFGVLGLIIMSGTVLSGIRDYILLSKRPYLSLQASWWLAIILATIVGEYTETLFCVPTGLSSFMLVLACAGLRTAVKEGSKSPQRLGAESAFDNHQTEASQLVTVVA